MRTVAKSKKSDRPTARFRVGDRVAVSDDAINCCVRGRVGAVRRVFWAPGGGGQSAGWVCLTDIRVGRGQQVALWEHLLRSAE